MSKWLEDLLLNIEIWLYRRLRKLLQHGGEDFAVSLDTLHATIDDKKAKVDAVYNHLEERLVNVEEGVPVRPLPADVEGLPSVRDLNHLRASVGLLADRKIEDASPDIPDGVSLVRLLCDSSLASQVTELIDTNHDWVLTKQLTGFSLQNLVLNCKSIDIVGDYHITLFSVTGTFSLPYVETIHYGGNLLSGGSGETLIFPNLTRAWAYRAYSSIVTNSNYRNIIFPKMTYYANGNSTYSSECIVGFSSGVEYIECSILLYDSSASNTNMFNSCANLKTLNLPSFSERRTNIVRQCQNLQTLILGKITRWDNIRRGDWSADTDEFVKEVKLIHFELGDGSAASINVATYSPTIALRTDTTASDYIDLREDKDEQGEFINATNLEQWISNFRKYIITRLASRKGSSALTLTLSSAVYNAAYGLDSSSAVDPTSLARTMNLHDLKILPEDITNLEIEAFRATGETDEQVRQRLTASDSTIMYADWLDTYRSYINWNIAKA